MEGQKNRWRSSEIRLGGIPECGLDFILNYSKIDTTQTPLRNVTLYEGVLELIDVKKGIKSTVCTQKFENSAKKSFVTPKHLPIL